MSATTAPTRPARDGAAVRPSAATRRRAVDRIARYVVIAGGFSVIASILAILVFLVLEVWPLTRSARVTPAGVVSTAGGEADAIIVDPHRTHAALLGPDGDLRIVALGRGEPVMARSILPPGSEAPLAAVSAAAGEPVLAAATRDGRIVLAPVDFAVTFEGDVRSVRPTVRDPIVLELDPEGRPLPVFSARLGDGGAAAAAALPDGSIALAREVETTSFLSGAKTRTLERTTLPGAGPLSLLLLDRHQRALYGATPSGDIVAWDLTAPADTPPEVAKGDAGRATALALLIGDRSLVVGRAGGELEVWFRTGGGEGKGALHRVRTFPPLASAVRLLAVSDRNRSFAAQDASGDLGLYYSTSDRELWRGASPLADATSLAFAPKGDALVLAGARSVVSAEVENPHPESSLAALFGRVWYEGDAKPTFVWQSSSGSDDFEPKLSLTPLLVGTLKGTFYSLVLALPLAVLGAMYTSQFMHPRLQRVVKPTVELMASLPSVVLGFLAGLWLAPLVERNLAALLVLILSLPLLAIASGALWSVLPRRLRARVLPGTEVLFFMLVLAVGGGLAFQIGGAIERTFFAGSLPTWLYDATGLRYDQRNAVVVGVAMGFAVVPIIFAISEDAFSNVPRSLTAGSLALGASAWQTVVRVVLPTASAGVFSAVMIGFGRAVGETMIVLMATGNTPIMDWSPFNGFRTLSANIAVEVPEAPAGSTLYRTLFLAALLLFVLTFVVNTAADVVRQRLRRKYARL